MGTWLVLDTGEAQVHLGSAAEAYTRTRVLHADGGPDVGAAAAVLLLEFLDDARPDVHRLSIAALARASGHLRRCGLLRQTRDT
ncbi:hypothetical protein ABZ467_39465 [Streptomyces sp. NPDC005727]|uniref:hypothetical protein n=1 Tax=Streptomyces sp. NPDC005727 TaxID=3157053 RepID=UPI0033F61222